MTDFLGEDSLDDEVADKEESKKEKKARKKREGLRRRDREAAEGYGWETYKRLLRDYVRPYWHLAAIGVVAMVIMSGSQAGFVALLQPLLDGGFVERDPDVIRWIPFAVVGIFLVHGISHFLAQYLIRWVGRQMVKRMRTEIHEQILRLPNSYFDRESSGRLISRLTYDSERVAGSATTAAITLVRDGAKVIFLFGYMVYLSFWLLGMLLVLGPIMALIINYVTKRFRRISRRIHHAVGGVANVAEETVEGYQVVKVFGQGDRERQRFEQVNEENRRQQMKFMITKFVAAPVIQLIAAIMLAIVIYLSTVDAVMETLTVGTFVSFAGAVVMLNKPMKGLTQVNAVIQKGITAADNVFALLDTPRERDTGTIRIDRARGELAYRRVDFSYESSKGLVLRDIDLHIQPGERVALVGRSGGGKTTMVNLIPRFYEPVSGRIELDGVPLNDYVLDDLRRQIALVGQSVVLFNDTIANNIAYGALHEPTREEVREAADAAYALNFVDHLPDGLDTIVGENGVMLSGGQRQRIAIARALLKDAPILILDEATSALDSESEIYVQQALDKLMEGRTTLVIAHRLSTIENADKIVVLEEGRMLEQGTHSELLQRDGRYQALYRLQFQDEEIDG